MISQTTMSQAPSIQNRVLSGHQQTALNLMRKKFHPELSQHPPIDTCGLRLDDACFLRYLTARSFDFTKASNLLMSTIKWRHEFDIKGMYNNSPDWVEAIQNQAGYGVYYSRGYDKEGHLLYYEHSKNRVHHNHDQALKYLVYLVERNIYTMENTTGQEKVTMIANYEGFGMNNMAPCKTIKEAVNILQNYYPERLFMAYIINPPWAFNAIWTMISPFLDQVTKAKVIV